MEAQAFVERFGSKHGISPEIFAMILQAIMSIISSCPKNRAGIRAGIKSPNLWQRARGTRAVMESVSGVSRARARQIADDLFMEAASQPDEVLDKMIDECCDSSRW